MSQHHCNLSGKKNLKSADGAIDTTSYSHRAVPGSRSVRGEEKGRRGDNVEGGRGIELKAQI